MWSQVSGRALASATAGASVLAFTIYTTPPPYPPKDWSEYAKNNFPLHISLGLGPFQYYCAEKGAVAPTDQGPLSHITKPGIDARASNSMPTLASGVIATTTDSYSLLERGHMTEIMSRFRIREETLASDSAEDKGDQTHRGDEKHIVSLKRNFKDLPFSSRINFEQRREVERRVVSLLTEAGFSGTYYKFTGNRSPVHASEIPVEMMDTLRAKNLVFEAPWTVYDLATGSGRHWPDARGVWVVDENTVVWVNGEDHVEVVGASAGTPEVVEKIIKILQQLEKNVFFHAHPKFGYLTLKPENAGNGLTVSRTVDLGMLSKHENFAQLMKIIPFVFVPIDEGRFNLISTERFGTVEETTCVRRAFAWFKELDEINSLLKTVSRVREAENRIASILKK